VDALQAATRALVALYDENTRLAQHLSAVKGIRHGYINVGQINGGTNTNVVPGKVVLKIDRRMIPEEDPAQVEAALCALIERAVAHVPGTRVEIRRLLLAQAMKPLPGNQPLVDALCRHATELFGEPVEAWARRSTPMRACSASAASRP
jgi:acetylornithine deacetylase/succinyl-diaminopimelate desuccinylase-like protein